VAVVADDVLGADVAHAAGHVLEHRALAAIGGDDAIGVVDVLGLDVFEDDLSHLLLREHGAAS